MSTMSDSVSNEKVEDVLSSVRRLVSAELPRKRKDAPRGGGALVLTSAQRVEGGARERVLSKSLEERIAELEAAVSARSDEWEPDGSEDQTQHRPQRIVFRSSETPEDNARRKSRARLSELALVDTAKEAEADAEDATDAQPTFRHDGESPSVKVPEPAAEEIEEAPMEVDAVAPEQTAEIRPFRNPDDIMDEVTARWAGEQRLTVPEAPTPPEEESHDETETVQEVEPDALNEEVEVASAEGASTSADEASESLEGIPLELSEADFAKEPDAEEADARSHSEESNDDSPAEEIATDGEPVDVAGDDGDTAVSMDQDGVDEAAPVDDDFEAALSEAVAASVPDTLADAVSSQIEAAFPPAMDADALRPVVARLIREELQGELGERITRNVRKLVRQEIHRTLSARDIE